MAQTNQLPYFIREEIFKDLPKEKASHLSDLIEKSIDTVFSSAKDIAIQKKLEIKDELGKELASKSDLALVKSELKSEIRLYFVILLSVMIILNKDSISFIAQLIGLVK